MAKLFKFNKDKVERKNWAKPMTKEDWFHIQRPLLLWMANKSKDGQKLLGLEQSGLERITRISANFIGEDKYVRDGGSLFKPLFRRVTTTEVRTIATWANLINSQWDWFCELSREYYSLMEKKRLPHVGQFAPVTLFPNFAYGTTSTFYPDSTETTSQDGWVQHSTGGLGTGVDWGVLVAAAGTSADNSDADIDFVDIASDNVTDKW